MTGPSPPDRSETLESLVFETLERLETEGPSAIESAVSNHPDLEQELRARLGALQSMGLLSSDDRTPLAVPSNLGKYEIGQRIGEGGMGLVFRSRDTVLDRDVALKLIRPELVSSESLRERFTRESLAIARLQHPAVGRIFDAGELAGFPYMAMEHIPGCTLHQVLDRLDGRDPETLTGRDFQAAAVELTDEAANPREAPAQPGGLFAGSWGATCMRIGVAVAEGLASAHAAGVLHRDIKASNVMITPGGRVILIDFGLAQLDSDSSLTKTGGRVGSLPYIAPERVTDACPATEAADIYGLGVLLYELLTLRLPFRASSEGALVKLIARSRPEPLRTIHPGLPPLFCEVVERAMRRDPGRRPPSAGDYAVDLSRVLAGQPPLPHGDGPVAAFRSRWQAQPVLTAALVACGVLLLFLPAAILSVKVRAAERSDRSDELSLVRLGLALGAADDLQESLPIADVVDGSSIGELRTNTLEALVRLRATILSDPSFGAASRALQAEALLSQGDALLRLHRTEEAREKLGQAQTVLKGLEGSTPASEHVVALSQECSELMKTASLQGDASMGEDPR